MPIARPEEISDAFKRLTVEPTPVGIFGNILVPREITDLWLQARLARDRYFSALAHHVMIHSTKEDENEEDESQSA